MSKGPNAYRTISEAADEVGVPQHVLRFWETKFAFLKPLKRAGGRRFYRPQDLDVLRGVKTLLHDEGYTIKGVQKLHKDHGVRRLIAAADADAAASWQEPSADDSTAADAFDGLDGARVATGADRARLAAALAEVERVKARLDALLDDRKGA